MSFGPVSKRTGSSFPALTISGTVRAALLLCVAALFSLFASNRSEAQTQAETRVALVIGNGAYPKAPLANPTNDAKAVGMALRDMGFGVIEIHDASKDQMKTAIAQVARALKGRNGVGMLYFAGHGLQVDWHNYLVPVDARIQSADDVRAQTVDIQVVIDAFRLAGNRLSIVVLDACRDNPFTGGAGGKGLASMDAPTGTLLAYATAPGNVAEDGDASAGNGLYTHHLVREIRQPGIKVEDVFKRVRQQVRKQSAGRQIPWESTSLEDDFYFDPTIQVVKQVDAEASARENADWARIEKSMRADDFAGYLHRHPKGVYIEEAQVYLDQLRALSARGVAKLPDVNNRFTVGDELEYESIDGYTKLLTPVLLRVTFADNDRVEFNDGRFISTQSGSVLRDSLGRHEPARVDTPADLGIGKTWRTTYTTTPGRGPKMDAYCDHKVVAFEDVSVPAGTFKAFRIEREGQGNGVGVPTFKITTWFDPTTMLIVREDMLNRYYGRIDIWRSHRLVGTKRVKRRMDPASPS